MSILNKFRCPDNHIICDINLGCCPVCNKPMILDCNDQNWLDALAMDSSMWDTDAFDSYPAIIAYEYWRLLDLIKKRQPYGVYFMIKDVMEVILKFYVLSICAWSNDHSVSEFNEKIMPQITTPNMSLGNWLAMGKLCLSFYDKSKTLIHKTCLIHDLSIICKYYESHNFVNWRNEKIAHGSLANDDDLLFREDVSEKLKEFRTLFNQIDQGLKSLCLMIDDKSLIGYKSARNIEYTGSLYLGILTDTGLEKIKLDPFVVVISNGVYFFDNQKKPKITQMQCFPEGKRLSRQIPYFSALSKMLKEDTINPQGQIDDEYRSYLDEIALDQIGLDVDFIEPRMVTEWFREKITQHSKGIFTLEMYRGMGKSTYTERLNGLRNNPLVLSDDLDVRTYHMNRSQLLGASDFEYSIEAQWEAEFGHNNRIRAPRISDFLSGESNKSLSVAFIKFLQDYLYYVRKKRGKSRIVMVLDGIDEITNDRIWEYIPNSEQLPDGIYIIMTYRAIQEGSIPAPTVARLKEINATERLVVTPESYENRTFLQDYLSKNLKKTVTEDLYSYILQKSGYRILYLSLLTKLIMHDYPLTQIQDGPELTEAFFELLESQYGYTEFERLKNLIALFCINNGNYSLSMNDLSYLSDCEHITFDLLGKVSDLMSILTVERGFVLNGVTYQGQTRYRISNPDIIDSIVAIYPDIKEKISQYVLAGISECEESTADTVHQGIPFSENDLVQFARFNTIGHKKTKDIRVSFEDRFPRMLILDADGEVIFAETMQYSDQSYDENDAILYSLTGLDCANEILNRFNKQDGLQIKEIVSYLLKMKYSRRVLQKELIKAVAFSLMHIIEEKGLIAKYLDDYYQLTSLVGYQYIQVHRFNDALDVYSRFLDQCRMKGLDAIVENMYQCKILTEVGEILLLMNNDSALLCFNNAESLLDTNDIQCTLRIYRGKLEYYISKGMDSFVLQYTSKLYDMIQEMMKNPDIDLELKTSVIISCADALMSFAGKEESNEFDMQVSGLMDLACNMLENAHRQEKLHSYDLLISFYLKCGKRLSLLNNNGIEYKDWAMLNINQAVYLLEKQQFEGEYVNNEVYINALTMLIHIQRTLNLKNQAAQNERILLEFKTGS